MGRPLNVSLRGIETGKGGNVRRIYREKSSGKVKLEDFDVDLIHGILAEEEKKVTEKMGGDVSKRPNAVLVGFSTIFDLGSIVNDKYKYEAVYSPYLPLEEKSNVLKKNRKLAFLSGSQAPDPGQLPSGGYIVVALDGKKEAKKKTKKNLILIGKPEDLVQSNNQQKVVKSGALESKWKDYLDGYLRTWRSSKDPGPMVDSEQVLLHYLSQTRDKDLMIDHLIKKRLVLSREFLTEKTKEKISDAAKSKKEWKSIPDVKVSGSDIGIYWLDKPMAGFLIHLYSKREICQYCALSLARAQYFSKRFEPYKVKMKTHNQSIKKDYAEEPFVRILTSSSSLLTRRAKKKDKPSQAAPARPLGVPRIQRNLLSKGDKSRVDLTKAFRDNYFLQFNGAALESIEVRRQEEKKEKKSESYSGSEDKKITQKQKTNPIGQKASKKSGPPSALVQKIDNLIEFFKKPVKRNQKSCDLLREMDNLIEQVKNLSKATQKSGEQQE